MTELWEECQPSVICFCRAFSFIFLSVSLSCYIRTSFHNVYYGRVMA